MTEVHGLAELAASGAAIHLMGIGGAGMAGLALLLAERGAAVSGCDRERNETTQDLESRGMAVHQGHSPDHADGQAALVHTAAVPADHPELEAARAQGTLVLKRSEALAELVNSGSLIAIAGTHGKTTTSALTAMALEAAGVDPTALVGGRVQTWGGNARIGGTTYVVEADEYDRSFLSLWPKVAVVTSVEAEHLDTYTTVEELETAFDEFVSRVPDDGRVIACADDAGARRRLAVAADRSLSYGIGHDSMLRATGISYEPDCTRFTASFGGRALGEFELALQGPHNLRNSLAVLSVMVALELDPQAAAPVFALFTGVERRFQYLGAAAGVTVIDDYAHHPTEVAATLETARQAFAGRRLVVAFQPHLYTRTRAFAHEFGETLAGADLVFITGIYPAREPPIPGVSAELVVEAARSFAHADRVRYAEDLEELFVQVRRALKDGDVFITLGAGDITSVAHSLVDELRRSHVDA
ncbi:MAG: UDP-N-acetylmuramate--L-alanine ligase [Gemmatimonadota bacterium]|nr:MAG: UDP-N-acetylmuramate--L-alanine ligase [Gemmatimonadota bacterium]